MDFLIVDPSFSQNCAVYNAPPYLILVGLLAIAFFGCVTTFGVARHLLEGIRAFRDGYCNERKLLGPRRAKVVLFLQIAKNYMFIGMLLFLVVIPAVFILGAVNILLALVNNGCI